MKFYLDKQVESIPVFKTLLILLKEALKDPKNLGLLDVEDIEDTTHLMDPVGEFLDFYIEDNGLASEFPSGRIAYIKSALYAAKGAPRIFEIFNECFGVSIEYTYNFPVLELIEFSQFQSTNPILYLEKFENMIYYLLYYSSIKAIVDELILTLKGDITQYRSLTMFGYKLFGLNKQAKENDISNYIKS